MTDRIWIWFAENGNIRKWDAKSFHEGTEYVVAAHADAELEEMTRSFLAERKASAEKDARIAQLEAESGMLYRRADTLAQQNKYHKDALTASRAECEGLRAAAKSFSIYTIEDDEDSIRLSTGGVQVACWSATSQQGIALLKLDAEFRAALQKEPQP